MDYAFAPLPDNNPRNQFNSLYRHMFPHRPSTTLVHQARLTRVEDFLDHVENEPGLARPVGSFIVASHGNDTGWIELEIDTVSHEDAAGNPIVGTTYEVLINADTHDTIEIPNALINPRPPGSPATAVFHIRGCNVGLALPFLQKLKVALGGNVNVSAPKVFDQNKEIVGQGVYEYMGYNFKIIRRDAFANRNQLIAAYQGAGLTFIDNSAVPSANWGQWIPNNIGVGVRGPRPFANFGQQVGGQAGQRLRVQFRHNWPAAVARYTYTIGGVNTNPGDAAARLQLLRNTLPNDPLFKTTHAFPEYQRLGYANLQDFVDGYRWRCNWNSGPSTLVCNGRRHVYVVIPPVTDPATGNLLLNYYPDNDNPADVKETLLALATSHPAQYQRLFQVV